MANDKKQKNLDHAATHVVLTKYPARKAFLLVITCVLTVLFTLWIWAGMKRSDMPWIAIGLPMIFIGMLANFLQPEEEWNYTPWQETTQKYEKNIYD